MLGFGWLVLIAAVIFMYRVAEAENRSGVFWGGVTFVLCLISTMLIGLPFIDLLFGIALSFGAMLIVNLLERRRHPR